jgi:hypothetical protein
MNQKVLACLLASSLFACGDDGGHPHQIPDSKPADAQMCQAVSDVSAELDYAGFTPADGSDGAVIFWTGQLGTFEGETLYYDIGFYDGVDTITGTIDLGSDINATYATCAVCVLAYTLDADDNIAKAWFQSGGTMNVAADPIVSKNLNAMITGLKLIEISPSDASPITGGSCLDYTDGTLMHNAVPNAWSCDDGKYNSGGSCSCLCGIVDPDCNDTTTAGTLEGCTGGENMCARKADASNTECVTRPLNDTCEDAELAGNATLATIVLGTPKNGTTSGAKHDYDKDLDVATCTNAVAYGLTVPGPDVVYKVTLTGGTNYTFTLNGLATTIDLGLAVVGPAPTTNPASICKTGAPPIPAASCVKGKDDGGNGVTETFTYQPTTTGTYYVIVDSWNYNVGGNFTLTVQ